MKIEYLAASAIEKYNMLKKGERVLVGLSGGADSICLVSVLLNYGCEVVCAHVNHGMRDTALRDENFCREFCECRGIEFEAIRIEPGKLKSEDDARRVRYDFFRRVMREKGILKLATAHNKNDSAETVILHMLRGASTDGLGGILPYDGEIVRPLIFAKKNEIIKYCNENGLVYMTDETNLEDIYARNRLRNNIIPQIQEHFNPKIIDTIADNAVYTAQDAAYLKKTAYKAFEESARNDGADIEKLKKLDSAILTRVIRLMWQKAANSGQTPCGKHIDAVCGLLMTGKTGNRCDLPMGVSAEISYGVLRLKKRRVTEGYEINLELDKWYKIPGCESEMIVREGGGGLEISLDGTEKITARSRRSGDRFSPRGMNGSKTIADFFSDKKIDRAKREYIPIFLANNEIFAVGDMRADRRFAPGRKNKLYSVEIRRI